MERVYKPGKYQFKIKRSKAGLGLYTKSAIPKGACVIEYTGRILSDEEEQVANTLYLFEVGKTKTLDGSARSNTARYINHSCRPNCEAEIDEKRGRVFIFARRNIKAGEELGYDYGKSYFNAHIKPKGCRCIKCRPDLHAASPVR